MDAVLAFARRRTSADISGFLDDLLQKHADPLVLSTDLSFLQSTLLRLGWLVNLSKSDLSPSQEFCHLGMQFRTVPATVELTIKRRDKLLAAVGELREKSVTTPERLRQS